MSQQRDELLEMVQRLPEGKLAEALDVLHAIIDGEDAEDFEDSLSPEERAALHASINRGLAQVDAGMGRPAAEFFAELKASR